MVARRPALTRLEVIVAVVIAAILVGLSCSAFIKAREAAHRANCQCHLKAISLAAHNYESYHGNLPPGLVGALPEDSPNSLNFPNHGALTFMLPYIERDTLFKQFVRYEGGEPVAGGMVFVNDPRSPK